MRSSTRWGPQQVRQRGIRRRAGVRACGRAGALAIAALAQFLDECRQRSIPIFYSKFELARDGSDAGVYAMKRGLPDTGGWCFEGSEGAAILQEVAPGPDDIIFVKKKPSAFLGTPFLGYLISRGIDTLLITGVSVAMRKYPLVAS
jgi:maleamate amidohydrolase